MKKKLLSSIVIGLSIFTGLMASDNTEELNKFAASLVGDCALSDGYICETIAEDDFLSEESAARMIPAVYLPAWNSAYQAFNSLEDLTAEQKALKHYKIGFTESESDYIILFAALLLPAKIENDMPVGFSTITFGRTIKFWIDKQTLGVTKYLYYD